MKAARRYQVLPDQAACHQPGCPWHFDGDTTEMVAEAHAAASGHEVRITTSARVIFNGRQPAKAGAR
jgi:hypothetical protein